MKIKILNLNIYFYKDKIIEKKAINNFSFEFDSNNFYGIIGNNGSGKTSLLPYLNTLKFNNNESYFDNNLINNKNKSKNKKLIKDIRKKIIITLQFPEHQIFKNTVEKEIRLLEKNFKISINRENVIKKYKDFNFQENDILNLNPFLMSSGEKRKHIIILAFLLEPEIIILDEPTSGLDPISSKYIFKKLSEYVNKDKSIIVISHNLDMLYKYANYFLIMHDSHLLLSGNKSIFKNKEVFDKAKLKRPLNFLLDNLEEGN